MFTTTSPNPAHSKVHKTLLNAAMPPGDTL